MGGGRRRISHATSEVGKLVRISPGPCVGVFVEDYVIREDDTADRVEFLT